MSYNRGSKTDSLKLSRIHGTEQDRVNCPFYFKIGACRHGPRCSRQHNKPTASPTILLPNMYQHPALAAPRGPDGLPLPVDARVMKEHFEDFFEDIFDELAKYGDVEQVNVCDNLGDHLVGNVYVKFTDEEGAARAMKALQGRYYQGRAVNPEYSPVTDFKEATCRQFEQRSCQIGPYCNFLHVIMPDRDTAARTFGRQKRGRYEEFRPWQRADRGRSPSRPVDRDLERIERIRDSSRERRRVFEQWNRDLDERGELWGLKIHRWGTRQAADAQQENVLMPSDVVAAGRGTEGTGDLHNDYGYDHGDHGQGQGQGGVTGLVPPPPPM